MYRGLINILLVDDDPADRRLAELALKNPPQGMEFTVQAADTLAKGIELLNKENFNLLLLDLNLPDSSGIETVEKFRQANANIPIIVLTGLSDEDAGAEAIKSGAIDYVMKPFNQSGLRTRIGVALQIVELQEKLLSLANTDELTGLANRRHFFDILEREILRAKMHDNPLSVVMIDIDHFKSINDTYGHHAGDDILKQMGQIILENIYPLDVAARYGGEELIILMPATSSDKAFKAAEKLRRITDRFRWKAGVDEQVSITTSAGVAGIDSNNLLDAYDLVEKADEALYTAKRQGRNRVVCWEKDKPPEYMREQNDPVYQQLQTKIAALTKKLQSQAIGTISAFTKTMDIVTKDPYIVQHGENVRAYAVAIAEEMNLSVELKKRIAIAALLQDLGKISIPTNILKKTSPLTEEEQEIIRQHPKATAQILEPVGIFSLELQIIKYHHERFDGNGYPNGLKGREIPIGSRILAVADTFDAITSSQPHRLAQSCEYALKEIRSCSNTQFDPEIVEAFVKAFEKNHLEWPLTNKRTSLEYVTVDD